MHELAKWLNDINMRYQADDDVEDSIHVIVVDGKNFDGNTSNFMRDAIEGSVYRRIAKNNGLMGQDVQSFLKLMLVSETRMETDCHQIKTDLFATGRSDSS